MSDFLDYGHAGYMAADAEAFARGARFADEDRAHAILHAYAAKWTEAAVRTARARHGEGWAALIERQAMGEDW